MTRAVLTPRKFQGQFNIACGSCSTWIGRIGSAAAVFQDNGAGDTTLSWLPDRVPLSPAPDGRPRYGFRAGYWERRHTARRRNLKFVIFDPTTGSAEVMRGDVPSVIAALESRRGVAGVTVAAPLGTDNVMGDPYLVRCGLRECGAWNEVDLAESGGAPWRASEWRVGLFAGDGALRWRQRDVRVAPSLIGGLKK